MEEARSIPRVALQIKRDDVRANVSSNDRYRSMMTALRVCGQDVPRPKIQKALGMLRGEGKCEPYIKFQRKDAQGFQVLENFASLAR